MNSARIEASLADRRPGEFFIVDANGGMTVETALRMLRLLPPGVDFVLEAACATWRECMARRRRTDVPMIWDVSRSPPPTATFRSWTAGWSRRTLPGWASSRLEVLGAPVATYAD